VSEAQPGVLRRNSLQCSRGKRLIRETLAGRIGLAKRARFRLSFREADFSGGIVSWDCNCPASSSELSYAAWFRRALELGVSECQLKRGGSEIVLAKRNRRVRFSG